MTVRLLAFFCVTRLLLQAAEPADPFGPVRDKIRQILHPRPGITSPPSIAVAVVKDGKIVWEEGFGWAELEKGAATAHTVYPLSSVTKMFTGVGLMTLVKSGKVDLDKPANDYLGDAKIVGRGGDARDATVRRLANHTAGLPIYFWFSYADRPEPSRPIDAVVMFPPGETVRYSNLGYGVLGQIIAHVSGQPYEDFMRKQVFEKLGLTETSFGPASTDAGFATSYATDGNPLPRFVADPEAAMGIYSSVHDLARFAMFLLKTPLPDQQPILADAQIDEMQKPTGMVGKDAGWGIGSAVSILPSGQRIIAHVGDMKGASGTVRLIPSEKLAIIALSNFESSLPNIVANQIMNIMLRAKPQQPGEPALRPVTMETRPSLDPIRGAWTGIMHTPKDDQPVSLRVSDGDIVNVKIAQHPETSLAVGSWRNNELRGQLHGPFDSVALDLLFRGNKLSGSATVVTEDPERNGNAVSYYVELNTHSNPK